MASKKPFSSVGSKRLNFLERWLQQPSAVALTPDESDAADAEFRRISAAAESDAMETVDANVRAYPPPPSEDERPAKKLKRVSAAAAAATAAAAASPEPAPLLEGDELLLSPAQAEIFRQQSFPKQNLQYEEGTRASTIVCGALLFLDHSRPALGAEMLRYLAAFGLDDLDPIACLMRGWGAQALPARARTAACNVAQACGSGDFSGVAEDLRILSILMRQAITVTDTLQAAYYLYALIKFKVFNACPMPEVLARDIAECMVNIPNFTVHTLVEDLDAHLGVDFVDAIDYFGFTRHPHERPGKHVNACLGGAYEKKKIGEAMAYLVDKYKKGEITKEDMKRLFVTTMKVTFGTSGGVPESLQGLNPDQCCAGAAAGAALAEVVAIKKYGPKGNTLTFCDNPFLAIHASALGGHASMALKGTVTDPETGKKKYKHAIEIGQASMATKGTVIDPKTGKTKSVRAVEMGARAREALVEELDDEELAEVDRRAGERLAGGRDKFKEERDAAAAKATLYCEGRGAGKPCPKGFSAKGGVQLSGRMQQSKSSENTPDTMVISINETIHCIGCYRFLKDKGLWPRSLGKKAVKVLLERKAKGS